MDWETVYKYWGFWNWTILFILSLFSYFLLSPKQTFGVIIGGLLIITNFKILQHSICKIFHNADSIRINKISIILKYYIRLLILGLVIFVMIMNGWIDPVGLAIGLSTVITAITVFGISTAFKIKDKEAS